MLGDCAATLAGYTCTIILMFIWVICTQKRNNCYLLFVALCTNKSMYYNINSDGTKRYIILEILMYL